MTGFKRCPICKSMNRITRLHHPIENYMKDTCCSCIHDSIPEGATVAMFINTVDRARWYINITREQDIIELERIGIWAQGQGKNMIELYIYTNWRVSSGIGPVSFSFGHEHSLEYLSERMSCLREKLPLLKRKFTEISPETYQAILDV